MITGGDRRRRRNPEDRVRILAAIEKPGAMVAEVARREDVCTSLVYKWRRAAQRTTNVDACKFAPVIVEAPPPATTPTLTPPNGSDPGVVEVNMKGARVRICANAPSAVIAATLKALRP